MQFLATPNPHVANFVQVTGYMPYGKARTIEPIAMLLDVPNNRKTGGFIRSDE